MLWNEGQLRLEFALQLHLMTNSHTHTTCRAFRGSNSWLTSRAKHVQKVSQALKGWRLAVPQPWAGSHRVLRKYLPNSLTALQQLPEPWSPGQLEKPRCGWKMMKVGYISIHIVWPYVPLFDTSSIFVIGFPTCQNETDSACMTWYDLHGRSALIFKIPRDSLIDSKLVWYWFDLLHFLGKSSITLSAGMLGGSIWGPPPQRNAAQLLRPMHQNPQP